MFHPSDWYHTPLYYDIVFDVETRAEADFLEAVRARYGRTRGRRVFEPACGSGRLVAELARRGWSVTGVDLEPDMLRFARRRLRRRGLAARLVEAPIESWNPPAARYDLAHCLVSSFRYLRREADARAHLRRVAAGLKPGGIAVLGLHLSEYDDRRVRRERWTARRGGVDVTCVIQSWPPDVRARTERFRSRLTVTRRSGDVRRYETNWTFRTYDEHQIAATLRAVPELEHVATFDFDLRLDEPTTLDGDRLDVVVVLRRRTGLREAV